MTASVFNSLLQLYISACTSLSTAVTVMLWLHKYNYFSLCRCPSETILFQRVETRLKLFQKLTAALVHEYFLTCSVSLK